MTAMTAEHDELGAALVDGLDQRTIDAAVRAIDHVRARLEHLIAEHERELAARDEGA